MLRDLAFCEGEGFGTVVVNWRCDEARARIADNTAWHG